MYPLKNRFNKRLILLLFLFLSYIVIFSIKAEEKKAVVAVFPLLNRNGDEQLRIISSTVTDTVTLMLKMLQRYRVIEKRSPPVNTPGNLGSYSDYMSVDNIIFGELFRSEEDAIVILMNQKKQELAQISPLYGSRRSIYRIFLNGKGKARLI